MLAANVLNANAAKVRDVDLPEILILAFGAVRTQDRGIIPFKPFPWQYRYLEAAKRHPRIIIDKSREIGSSTIAVLQYTAEVVLFGGDFLIASYKRESSEALFETAVTFLDNLRKYSRALGIDIKYSTKTKTELVLSNKSHIKAMEMTPKVGRSFRFRYLLASEVAFWDDAVNSFNALQGASVKGSKQTLESTPNPDDVRGLLWEDLLKNPTYFKIVQDWRGNPAHDEKWKQDMLDLLGPRGFAQEYECDHTRSVSGTVVIPLELYEKSIASPGNPTGEVQLGVDVARYGDDHSVIAARNGNVVEHVWKFSKVNTTALAQEVANIVLSSQNVTRVKVDAVGVGAGVVDELNAMNLPCEIVEVVASEAATNPERYVNKRAEMYFNLKQEMMAGARLPADSEIKKEILHTHYKFTANSRIQIESKETIRKHLGHSPDELDAIALAFYDDVGDEVVGGFVSYPARGGGI